MPQPSRSIINDTLSDYAPFLAIIIMVGVVAVLAVGMSQYNSKLQRESNERLKMECYKLNRELSEKLVADGRGTQFPVSCY